MATTYKTLAELKAEAIARYEKKEKMLHLQPSDEDEIKYAPHCENLLSEIETVHYDIVGSIVGLNGRTVQKLRIDGDIVEADLLFENHCWCLSTNSSLYKKLSYVMDWVICSAYTPTH